MIRSMTAFSRQESHHSWGSLIWEIRAVNHRYLEPSSRLPEDFRPLENQIRQAISRRLKRGKIDCTLRFHPLQTAAPLNIDEPLTRQLIAVSEQLRQLTPHIAALNPMDVLNWPGVIHAENTPVQDAQAAALQLLDNALKDLVVMRETEGAQLKQLITQRCQAIDEQTEKITTRLPQVLAMMREKLSTRLQELCGDLDQPRIEQEIVILAQKSDITEELDRLRTHSQEIRNIMEKPQPVGRRLDFLIQELHREANTLCAKSIDTAVTQSAIELKVLIEQMREQVQNIE